MGGAILLILSILPEFPLGCRYTTPYPLSNAPRAMG